MQPNVQDQIDSLNQQIELLKAISVKVNIEPDVAAIIRNLMAPTITTAIAAAPTQTYSASGPTGSAPTGSLWLQDGGSPATSKIYVYSGSAWVQIK